jgi:hypothetical protein
MWSTSVGLRIMVALDDCPTTSALKYVRPRGMAWIRFSIREICAQSKRASTTGSRELRRKRGDVSK